MRTRRDVFSSKLGFEQLEGRRLLAADFAVSAMAEIDSVEPAQCHMVSVDFPTETDVQMELTEENVIDPSEDLGAELASSVDNEVDAALTASETESTSDVVESTTGEAGAMAESAVEMQQLDLSDGMDGFFGSLEADSPMESIAFTTPADGMVSIVMASSFDEGQVSITITDSNGDLVETDANKDAAFTILNFEAAENESYQMTVETVEAASEGQFQVTVGFDEFVDQHADEVGSDSTKLDWVEGQIDLTGKLESPGDVDTFRFDSDAEGEVMLQLHELEENDRVDLDVQVFDSDGNVLAEGATNEMLQVSFDVMSGEQYFVSVNAGENQKGDYSVGMQLIPTRESAGALATPESTDASGDPEITVDEMPAYDEASAIANDLDSVATDESAAILDESGEPDAEAAVETEVGDPVFEEVVESVTDDAGEPAIDETTEVATVEAEEPAVEAAIEEEIIDDAGEPVVGEILESVVDESGEPTSSTTEEEVDSELVENDPAVADISDEAIADCDESPVGVSEELIVDDDEITVDPEETESEVSIDEPTVPVDETIGDPETELPVEVEIINEELVDSVDELGDESEILVDDGSLITGEPESPIESEELDLESDLELTDPLELELVDNVEGDSGHGEEEAVVCFAGIETVDEFFAELGSLTADSSLDSQPEFGPFNIFGSNLNFWARGTSAGNHHV